MPVCWKTLENTIKEKCPNAENFYLTESIALFGTDFNFHTDNIIDFIILLAKNYIYRCKIIKSQMLISVIFKMLKARYQIERYNARINLELPKLEANWKEYKPLFEEADK